MQKQFPCQNHSIAEWTSQQVARWLMGLHLEHHIPEFTARNIDGEQLLQLESAELKVSGSYTLTYTHIYIFENANVSGHMSVNECEEV